MEIWLDTTDTTTIEQAVAMGFCHGITTNPSILAASSLGPRETLSLLLEIQDGPVMVQVTENNAKAMINQAQQLYDWDDRFIIKVPTNQQGLITIRTLTEDEIPVLATAVFTSEHAFLAAQAGAGRGAVQPANQVPRR